MINKKVAIIQKFIPHYRVEFFNLLEKKLSSDNIQLTVFAGTPDQDDAFNDGFNKLVCGSRVNNNLLLNKRVYWQNLFTTLTSYDLVIVEQSNAALLNLPLLLNRKIFKSNPKFAYWGHGAGLARKNISIREIFKRFLTNKADHWFGYTEQTRSLLLQSQISNDKITIVNNSIDISDIVNAKKGYNLVQNRNKWEISNGPTVIFCSRLSENKAVPFVVESCRIARNEITDLNLIIIGDGPLKKTIENMVKNDTWVTLTGALYGIEKANVLLMGDMLALPSGVGLSILDGFAAGLPIVTSDFKNNGPEIAYFENHLNGLHTSATPENYAAAIIELASNTQLLQKMKDLSNKTALHYSIQSMVENFSTGITKILL